MAILEKFVEITPNSRSLKHFRSLGYDAKIGTPIIVNVNDLMPKSRVNVTCVCDECGNQHIHRYSVYTQMTDRNNGKYLCKSCSYNQERFNKIINTNMERYGVKTTLLVPEVQDKIKKTNMEKYGVEHSLQSQDIYNKTRQSLNEHYGVESPFNSPEICEKAKQTCLEKYGVLYVTQVPEIREKIKKTNIERYGVPISMQNHKIVVKQQNTMIERYGERNTMLVQELKEKVQKTNVARYGASSVLEIPEFQEKIRKTNIEKYGGPSPTNDPVVREKQIQSLMKNGTVLASKQQKYLNNLYGGVLNGAVGIYNCDIVFYDKKYIVEFDGGGHLLSVIHGEKTEEEFKNQERRRFYSIKSKGFKQIRILSQKDFLPLDEVLMDIIKKSEEYFTTTEHTWINWDIDSGCFYNALNPDGIKYDFGLLRKIKEEDVA